MSKIDKILKKWNNRPIVVDWSEVESVLKRFEMDIDESGGGSHKVISHPKLIDQSEFGSLGEFCIPTKNGRQVKGFYLARILEAIEFLQEDNKE